MIDINVLKYKYELTLNETNTKILVNPDNKYCFTAYPLDFKKNIFELSADEYIAFVAGYYCFNDTLDGLELNLESQD